MEFLPALRETGIFNRRDRPFGMPNIESGNLGALLRQVAPVARRSNELDARNREMRQFTSSVRQPIATSVGGGHAERMALRQQSALRSGALGSINGGNAGFTPMQKRLYDRDDDKADKSHRMALAEGENANRLATTMQAANLREAGDTNRLIQELNARREMNSEDIAMRKADLEARRLENTTDRQARYADSAADRASRERIASMPARVQPTNPSQQGNAFENRVQQLGIANPAAAALLVLDPDTKQYRFSPNATPDQQKFIRDYLMGGQQTTKKRVSTRTTKGNPQKR